MEIVLLLRKLSDHYKEAEPGDSLQKKLYHVNDYIIILSTQSTCVLIVK